MSIAHPSYVAWGTLGAGCMCSVEAKKIVGSFIVVAQTIGKVDWDIMYQ